MSAIIENQFTGRTKRCNITDLKIKHPYEDWDLKPVAIGSKITQTIYLILTLYQIKFTPQIKIILSQIRLMTLLIPPIINTV